VNLMIFQSWGLLYAILQVLITALQMNSINNVLNGNGVLNAFVGSSQMVLLGAVSILFSIAIALIPFIASRIVRGEVGNTVFAVAALANRAARVVFSSNASSAQPLHAGPPSALSEPGSPTGSGPGPIGAQAGATASSTGGGLLSESKPPATLGDSSGPVGGSAGEIGASGAAVAV